MRLRQKCSQCSAEVDPELVKYRRSRNQPILCKSCHQIDILKRRIAAKEATIAERKAVLASRKCVVCDGPIAWKSLYEHKSKDHLPITCCTRCHAIYSARDKRYTKDEIEQRIREYIRQKGAWATYAEVTHNVHIASKVLSRHHISVNQLNKEVLGMQEHRHDRITCVGDNTIKSFDSLRAELCPAAKTYKELLHFVCANYNEPDKTAYMEQVIFSYIKQRGAYTGVTAIMRDLHISFDSLRKTRKIDIQAMNSKLGFVDTKSSWYEHSAYAELLKYFQSDMISREHVFTDCRSAKNYPLRVDFYIPAIGVVLEIDGEQHYDKSNAYYKQTTIQNDQIKDQYLACHGIRLYRVAAKPRHTFLDRLTTLIKDVVKPVELLETPPSKVEGNQQPSPDIREGSETIEKQQ